MRNVILGLALAVVAAGGCRQTGENEYQVEVPDIDVSRDTMNVRVPDLDIVRDTANDTLRRDTLRDTTR